MTQDQGDFSPIQRIVLRRDKKPEDLVVLQIEYKGRARYYSLEYVGLVETFDKHAETGRPALVIHSLTGAVRRIDFDNVAERDHISQAMDTAYDTIERRVLYERPA